MHELPPFTSYNSGTMTGFAPIYCGNKDEWNFLCKAIVHRTSLEDVIKKLDSDRDERATKALVNEVVNYFGSNMEKLHEKSNTQLEYLAKQSESLVKFLESQQLQPQASVPLTSSDTKLPPESNLSASDPTISPDDDFDYLKKFFPEKNKKDTLIPQPHIDFLTEQLTKEEDLLDIDALKEACKKAEIPYPKKLGKQISNPQVKSFIYELAVAFKKKEKRYIYSPIFSYKSENIVTSMFQSSTLTNKYPKISKKYHSKFRYFLNQCENLYTSPSNIQWLISLLSKSFYRREIVSYDGTYGTFNNSLYYAIHFSKILCLLMNRLIHLRDKTNIPTLFNLTCPLFCDIVTFHNLTSPTPRNFFVKHEKIIKLFRSLQEKYASDPTCANSTLYYIFSIFCKHSYIGETMDFIRRELDHTMNSTKQFHTSFLYSVLHSIGIEHFTFLHTPIPPFLRKPLEHQLISWFKPSLNSLHNSDFKSNIFSNPSIPGILKQAVISFKSSNPRSTAPYNINSPNYKQPHILCNENKKLKICPSVSFSPSYTIYHDHDRERSEISLLSLISECCDKMTFKPFFVSVVFGEHDATNFCFLQNEMPTSSAFGPDEDNESLIHLTITQLVTRLKNKSITNFLFLPAAPHILLEYHAHSVILPSIAKGLTAPISLLQNCHPFHLFKLYKLCYKMQSPLLQSLAKQKLSDLCYKFFHIRPTKIILFSIKLNEALSRNKIKTILFSFLKTLPISHELLLLLQSQTKVTFKSHPKISPIFCNHISWCKKWSEKPYPCHCSILSPILGLKNSPHKHISILGHETSSIFDSVLHANLNNVCSPNIKSFPEEFLNSFMTYYHGVLDFCESFKEPIPFLPLTLPSKIFVNKAFNRQFDILNSFRPQPPFIWKLIQELDSFPQTFQCPSNIPSTPQVLKAKRFLSDKLILSAPDKNSGIPDLYCPTILWENMRSSFWCNIHFQKQPHLSEQSILSYFKYTFDANNWNLYGSFNVHGSAPYPYMNRKFKDLSRNRGIISYFHHPLKDIYFRAAAGLMTCLKALDFFHTNLFNPMQALPTMKLLFLYLNNKFGSETVFHSWAADVKEMYDWLPQSDILRAVKWVLSYISKKYRRNSVAVFFKETKRSRIGKSYQSDESVNIPFEEIFRICEFEVTNAYFILNKVVFLQLLGCPQGGPGSPGCSMVVCIFYEHQFRCSIYDHLAFMFFFRYFDDLRAVVVHRSSDITTKSLVFSLLDKLQNQTYHPAMSLVLEECSENTFKFLEGKFTIQNDSLSCIWTSKNFESLQEKGKMKFFTSQDYFSYTGDKKKIVRQASIMGRLSTLLGYCFTDGDLLKSFGFLLVDLFARHFPKKVQSYT